MAICKKCGVRKRRWPRSCPDPAGTIRLPKSCGLRTRCSMDLSDPEWEILNTPRTGCGPAAPGDVCRMTCRRGRRPITTGGGGSEKARGKGC